MTHIQYEIQVKKKVRALLFPKRKAIIFVQADILTKFNIGRRSILTIGFPFRCTHIHFKCDRRYNFSVHILSFEFRVSSFESVARHKGPSLDSV